MAPQMGWVDLVLAWALAEGEGGQQLLRRGAPQVTSPLLSTEVFPRGGFRPPACPVAHPDLLGAQHHSLWSRRPHG